MFIKSGAWRNADNFGFEKHFFLGGGGAETLEKQRRKIRGKNRWKNSLRNSAFRRIFRKFAMPKEKIQRKSALQNLRIRKRKRCPNNGKCGTCRRAREKTEKKRRKWEKKNWEGQLCQGWLWVTWKPFPPGSQYPLSGPNVVVPKFGAG